jgi:Na+/H+ antiporter NhaD/arsenite permease-like protein
LQGVGSITKSSLLLFANENKTVVGLIILGLLSILLVVVPEIFGMKFSLPVRLTSLVLLSVYVLLSFEIVHRTAVAMTGAAIVILIGTTTGLFSASSSFNFVIEAIDFNTIGLLLGMMIMVAILGETGVFQYLGIKMSKASKEICGSYWSIFAPLQQSLLCLSIMLQRFCSWFQLPFLYSEF